MSESGLFRFTGFVDDKHLPGLMRAVAGKSSDFRVVPVANAQMQDGSVKAVASDIVGMFAAYCKKKKIEDFKGQEVPRAFLESVGRSPKSHAYLMKVGRQAGLLKQNGGGRYHVMQPKKSAAKKAKKK